MKKFMKGLLIGILAVVIGGVVLVVGCSALFDTAIQQEEQRANDLKNEVQEIVNNMEWRQNGDYLVGEFTNTTDIKISYLEIQYKFMDNEGNVIDSSFTNETEISPGETREIQIDTCLANGYTQYEMIVNEANSYEE